MTDHNKDNMSDSATSKKKNYSWLSLGLGFSVFPIMLLASPLLASLPQENDSTIYIGLSIGLLVVLLQVVGFVIGVIGLVRRPRRIMSGLGTLVCFIFCILVIGKMFK